ncbi:MAG: nucleotidyl transferase AbiEii/AbiGii toxin family protein, partial [Symbiobacteriaceae bacterium]|nr:nucleotidyl transferase AbiEii/AbiGii toxin family protein [Symbiobacteriaceae bacterium]
YSEDLDFVRVTSGGIGDIMKELTKLGIESGYKVTTRMGPFPKVYWSTTAQTGLSLRVKIEINTQERSPFLPLATIDHSIHTEWFTGSAAIRVYQNEEIAATKLRALYQRAKGRDLFDLWLLTCEAGADTETTCHAFSAYRPVGYTAQRAIDNLDRKLTDIQFRHDIDNLLATGSITYSVEEAAGIVINSYLQYL